MIPIRKLRPLTIRRKLFDKKVSSTKSTQRRLTLIHGEINRCLEIINNNHSDSCTKEYFHDWLKVLIDALNSVA